jgi:hypothetical protein
MANESKIEIIGNFFVVSDITTRVRYISEVSEDVVYNRDENDVFTFFKRGSFNTSTQGRQSSTLGLPNKSAFEFSECVDKDGIAFSSADDLELFLSTSIGQSSNSNGNCGQLSGFMDYNDTTGSISLTANTWTDIPNNGLGAFTNKTYKPDGVTELMDVATGYIDVTELNLGESILIRNDYTVNPNTNNSLLEFRYELGTGAGTYTLEKIKGRLDSGSNQDYRFSLEPDLIYMGDTNTRNNPIKLQIRLSTNGTLTNAGSVIQLLKR